MILWYSKITINKSSNVSHGRPTHPKKNSSHVSWFCLLEMVILLEILIIYNAKLTIIYLEITEKFMIIVYF